MSKVDFFKGVKSVVPQGRPRDAVYYLERIREGAVKDLVTNIRAEQDKEKKSTLKGQLSAVTFCGTFETRAKTKLKKASGLAIIDFDKLPTYDQLIELKEKLTKDEFIFSVWISPSGNGLKALVKIPVVDDDATYGRYYKSLYNHFEWINKEYNSDVIDKSGQDISRLCFESYDPDIYINFDSKKWMEFVDDQVIDYSNQLLGQTTNIPLTDQDQIANRLMIWFKKHYDANQRNNSFHKLAAAFNDFGVERATAERYILPYQQKDFGAEEILQLINSAYKKTSQFGSKCFEDKIKVKQIRSLSMVGKADKDIIKVFADIPEENIKQELELIRKEINVEEFWQYDEEGKLKISPHKFKFYLENKNYFKYYPIAKTKTFTFIQKEENFIDEVSEFQIKDFVLDTLMDSAKLDAWDVLANSSRAFNPSYLSMLATAEFNIEKDGQDFAWLYYRNHAIKVFADRHEIFNYNELDGFVWKKQVIDRDFITADHHDSEYRTFIWLCAGQSAQKYNSLKSVIGYLLHSYKTNANNKAIIFNDETISDNPNGGSGKSLFWNALSHIKKVASIDGKTFEFTKSFPYQSVPTDTQLLVFDDVKKSFNFEQLFSIITEGITLEYKGQDAIKLPVQDSPKIIITTNYTIKGEGGSFERRKFEVEMSSFFNKNNSPLDHFGHMLFDSWNELEWARFDHFMINCLQYFLENGLVAFPHTNLQMRKLTNETSLEFLEWMDEGDCIREGERITKSYAYNTFLEDYKDFKKWLTQKKFTLWIKKYCDSKNKEYVEGNSNGQRWFTITDRDKPHPIKENDADDIWDTITPVL
jgi:hypothetical protein